MNLTKLPDILQVAGVIMATARVNFNRDGHLTMASFLFGTRIDPATGAVLQEPGFNVVAFQPARDENDKDAYVRELGAIVRKSGAAGVGVLAEAWHASVQPKDAHLIVPGQINRLPGAREIAYFLLEHRDLPNRTRTWIAEVHRPANARPSMGAFNVVTDTAASFGRFTKLLGDD